MPLENKLEKDNQAYFVEMLQAYPLAIAQPFLAEEQEMLCHLIQLYACETFIGIGCGEGLYFEAISSHCEYLGIDPYYHLEQPKIINKKFQGVDLPRNNKLMISFLFNLLSYVPLNEVIAFLNNNTKQGDIITFSSWNTHLNAMYLRKHYLKSIETRKPEVLHNMNHIHLLCPNNIKFYKYHELLNFEYSKLLVIYL